MVWSAFFSFLVLKTLTNEMMSVKEYKAYMQACIEDMKTDPETKN